MSKLLLYKLNGTNNGDFRHWLDTFIGEPRIAWYPSAGEDFRDLLYLDQKYSEMNPATQLEPAPPDIFLHTDYFPWKSSTFLDNSIVHQDEHTTITVNTIEELPRCDLPLARELVHFPEGSDATGRAIFLEVEVKSKKLGTFTKPVVYVFVENAIFGIEFILPLKSTLSHIVKVRYGGGFGGGNSGGDWLLNILPSVHCELLIADNGVIAGRPTHPTERYDNRLYKIYNELEGYEDETQLIPIRTIPSASWSGCGDVTWNLVK